MPAPPHKKALKEKNKKPNQTKPNCSEDKKSRSRRREEEQTSEHNVNEWLTPVLAGPKNYKP